jgi:hypothetical protein
MRELNAPRRGQTATRMRTPQHDHDSHPGRPAVGRTVGIPPLPNRRMGGDRQKTRPSVRSGNDETAQDGPVLEEPGLLGLTIPGADAVDEATSEANLVLDSHVASRAARRTEPFAGANAPATTAMSAGQGRSTQRRTSH